MEARARPRKATKSVRGRLPDSSCLALPKLLLQVFVVIIIIIIIIIVVVDDVDYGPDDSHGTEALDSRDEH